MKAKTTGNKKTIESYCKALRNILSQAFRIPGLSLTFLKTD